MRDYDNQYHEDYSGERKSGGIITEHIVEETDTLPDIARKYNISIEDLVAANKDIIQSPADMMKPGIKIMIPNRRGE